MIVSTTASVLFIEFLGSCVKKLSTLFTFIGLYVLACSLLPFELSFPDEIGSIFKSGWLYDLLCSISFFVPVNFLLTCLLLIYACKYSHFFVSFINMVVDRFKN